MKKYLILSVGVVAVLCYQNCSPEAVNFSERSQEQIASENSDAEGDYGTGGGGFDCVSGQKLNVYLDPLATGVIDQNQYLGSIVSYQGEETAADNFNYFSESAHPIIGPVPIGFETNVFFYEGSDGLALTFYANIDGGGSSNNKLEIDITTEGNADQDRVLLSDDGNELKKVGEIYEGRFQYWNNTDGGVIGPFKKTSPFKIKVAILETGDIETARFYSANNFHFSLSSAITPVSSFVIANESYHTCD